MHKSGWFFCGYFIGACWMGVNYARDMKNAKDKIDQLVGIAKTNGDLAWQLSRHVPKELLRETIEKVEFADIVANFDNG